jgi:hypothetical protein
LAGVSQWKPGLRKKGLTEGYRDTSKIHEVAEVPYLLFSFYPVSSQFFPKQTGLVEHTMISALGRLRQEDCEPDTSLGYIPTPCLLYKIKSNKKLNRTQVQGNMGNAVFRHYLSGTLTLQEELQRVVKQENCWPWGKLS